MNESDFSNADWDQYFDEMSEDEYDDMVDAFESDGPLTMAIIASRDD